jgi:precorrin-6A/cobalt-precorrin-6A reductase
MRPPAAHGRPPIEDRRMILVLGGTAEARELADALGAAGVPVTSSLAGRVSRPRLPAGEVRIGGFGGRDAPLRRANLRVGGNGMRARQRAAAAPAATRLERAARRSLALGR